MTFDSGSCEEFIVILNSIGKIEKIRIGVEEAEDDFEWSVEKVSLFTINCRFIGFLDQMITSSIY